MPFLFMELKLSYFHLLCIKHSKMGVQKQSVTNGLAGAQVVWGDVE